LNGKQNFHQLKDMNMKKISFLEKANFNKQRQEYLSNIHYSSQKKSTLIISPFVVVILSIIFYREVCWQYGLVLAGGFLFQISYVCGIIFCLWLRLIASKKQ